MCWHNLFYEEIKKQNVKIVDLCNYVGFSKSAFYRKVDEKTQFTLFEMKKIIQYLNLSSPIDIFFNT